MVTKLQTQVAALEEGLTSEQQRSALLASEQAQKAEPTFADFGTRVGKILSLAGDEAKDLVTKAKTQAGTLTQALDGSCGAGTECCRPLCGGDPEQG